MRISRIAGTTGNLPSFGARDKKEKRKHVNKYAQFSRSSQSYVPPYYFIPPEISAQKQAKTVKPAYKPYFNIDELLSLQIPEVEEKRPRPFEETHALFKLDRYQQEAIDSYNSGKTTVVSAPTGTGKTLIAEHAIKDALDEGKRIIYLSPLKALSNEKYTEFSKLFGEYDEWGDLVNTDNVGLLTGDTVINPDAPLVVMTTEIYRNSLLGGSEEDLEYQYRDFDGVIYDEFHYLGDKARGTVWEEAVMNTPSHMKQMMLSATASNADEICNWVQKINGDIETKLIDVPETERHVPLRELVVCTDNRGNIKLVEPKKNKINPSKFENESEMSDREIKAFEELGEIIGAKNRDETLDYLKGLQNEGNFISSHFLSSKLKDLGTGKDKADSISLILSDKDSPEYMKKIPGKFNPDTKYSKVVKQLDKQNMTPALFYIFSKKGCDKELKMVSKNCDSLLTPEESRRVYDEVQACKDKGVFLGADFGPEELDALMKGFAVHHAGKLPAYKSLVENLARQGLVKVCFATETLIAGINMPFKTTVFTDFEKFDGEEVVDISPQIFKQGGGRAGRRGKDEIGNVVVMPKNEADYQKYIGLSKSTDTSIKSQYDISYASILSDTMLNNPEKTVKKSLAAYQNSGSIQKSKSIIDEKLGLLEERGFIKQSQDGTYERTEKGEIAKNVFGMNEIFLTEILYNPKYLEGFGPEELIAFCASFSDVKDEDPSGRFRDSYSYLNGPIGRIFNLMNEIDADEIQCGLKTAETPYSTNLVPYIIEFSKAPNERESALEAWNSAMDTLKERRLLTHEGDFLRVINSTIDTLKLIQELSPDENVRDNAAQAIESLRKPPVVDIFNYELAA